MGVKSTAWVIESLRAVTEWVCDVSLSCYLRLVDLILCVIWGWFWQPYYADHCVLGESHGRILWSCLLPRATLSCLQSTLVFWSECNTGAFLWMQQCCVPLLLGVLREHRLHILSKNLFSDHYLATCLPQCYICCFIIWLLVTSSWWLCNSLAPRASFRGGLSK